MTLKITFFNWRGAQGKTRLSYLAYRELNEKAGIPYAVVTNELSTTLQGVVDPKHLKILKEDEAIPTFPKNIGVIFDLGGFADSRVVDALTQSNCVIMPIIYDNITDFKSALSCVWETILHNPNVIIVANKAEKNDFARISKAFKEHKSLKKFNIPVFELKKSTAVSRVLDEQRTLSEIAEHNPLHKKPFSVVAKQFEDIFNHIITKY